MRKFFKYQSSQISYETYGEGQPVVLLHGFAEDGSVWQYQIDFLKNYCEVIVPEWWQVVDGGKVDGGQMKVERSDNGDAESDFGNNDKTPSTAIRHPSTFLWTMEDFADCIAAFIEHLATIPVILLGHSMGGYITLAVAEKHPQLLKGFGLVHSTAFADTDEKKATRKKSIEFIRSNGSTAFLKTSVPNLFGEAYKPNHQAEIGYLIAKGNLFSINTMIACCEAMMNRPNRTFVLQGSETPVLFILGEEDKAAPLTDVIKQVYLPETSHFNLLQKVGHMGMWEAPNETNGFILTFIQGFEK